MSECSFPLCTRHAQANGVCISHAQYAGMTEAKKEKEPLNKKSEKQAKQDRAYNKIVKEMLAADDRCEMKTPECTGKAQGLHHMKRRGINLLTRKYLKRSCNPCNGYVEKHPLFAIETGLSISVHKKEKK